MPVRLNASIDASHLEDASEAAAVARFPYSIHRQNRSSQHKMVSSRIHSNDMYKLFLQALMSRRVATERVTKALWRMCVKAVAEADPSKDIQEIYNAQAWDEFSNTISKMLDPFSLELKYFIDESNGERMYAITNTKEDEVAQLASDYSPTEIAFFKAVIEQIVLAPNHAFSVSSIAALREVSHLKPTMTKAQGEIILASFVARKWLSKSRSGRFSLGTRTLLELGAYLKNAYDESELLDCTVCFELVTKGYICARPNCKVCLHRHCYNVYSENKKMCPTCQQDWSDNTTGLRPVGENAIQNGEDEKRRTRRANNDEEDELDESQEMSQTQPSQTQSQTQGSRSQVKKRKPKKAAANGKNRKRAETPEDEESQIDDMYDDDTINIDDLSQIQEQPSRLHRRT